MTDNETTVVENEAVETAAPVEAPVAAEPKPADDVESIVAERLAQMKENMNRMSKERDEALKLKAEMEQAKKDADISRMKEEGKLQEALELEVADLKAKLGVYEVETTKLRRDGVLNDALAGMEFRNDKSRDMARREIVDQLVQDESGAWKHNSGSNINDYVAAYAQSEDNSYLFRVKSNTGAGSGSPAGAPSTDVSKAIGDMSTQEILALAAKGKLGSYNY
jgi:hypothetical protein